MTGKSTLEQRITKRISRKKSPVILRKDFNDLGSYSQVGRVLNRLVVNGIIIKIGYGLYARAKISYLTGRLVPEKGLPELAREALHRLGVETVLSTYHREYNAGRSTQVPTGRLIGVKGSRISRKIGYNGAAIHYERFR